MSSSVARLISNGRATSGARSTPWAAAISFMFHLGMAKGGVDKPCSVDVSRSSKVYVKRAFPSIRSPESSVRRLYPIPFAATWACAGSVGTKISLAKKLGGERRAAEKY